jgi:hypothetical protein
MDFLVGPDKPTPRVHCRFFPRGRCKQGALCLFQHDPALIIPPKPQPPPPNVTTTGPACLSDILAAALLIQWRGNGKHNAHLHGFHPRKALMNPESVATLLCLLPGRGPVLDPFIGAGTTAVEVMLQGRLAVGTDISPLAVGISRAHSWLISPPQLSTLRSLVEAVSCSFDEAGIELQSGAARGVIHRVATESEADADVILALWFLLDFEERYVWESFRKPKTLAQRFRRTAQRYIAKLIEFREAVPADTPAAVLRLWDARTLFVCSRTEPDGAGKGVGVGTEAAGAGLQCPIVLFDGVLTSPPYPGVYDYVGDENIVEEKQQEDLATESKPNILHCTENDGFGLGSIAAMDDPSVSLPECVLAEIGSKGQQTDLGRQQFKSRWNEDTAAWLDASGRVLKMGGRIAILIGDSEDINVLESVREACAAHKSSGREGYELSVVASASVREEDVARRPWAGHKRNYRTEHTILIEKIAAATVAAVVEEEWGGGEGHSLLTMNGI